MYWIWMGIDGGVEERNNRWNQSPLSPWLDFRLGLISLTGLVENWEGEEKEE